MLCRVADRQWRATSRQRSAFSRIHIIRKVRKTAIINPSLETTEGVSLPFQVQTGKPQRCICSLSQEPCLTPMWVVFMGRLEFRQQVHLRAHIGIDSYGFRLKLSAVYYSFHSWPLYLYCFMWRRKLCCCSAVWDPHCAFSYLGQHSTHFLQIFPSAPAWPSITTRLAVHSPGIQAAAGWGVAREAKLYSEHMGKPALHHGAAVSMSGFTAIQQQPSTAVCCNPSHALHTELDHIQQAKDAGQEASVPAETAQVLPWLGFKRSFPSLVACPAKGASENCISCSPAVISPLLAGWGQWLGYNVGGYHHHRSAPGRPQASQSSLWAHWGGEGHTADLIFPCVVCKLTV